MKKVEKIVVGIIIGVITLFRILLVRDIYIIYNYNIECCSCCSPGEMCIAACCECDKKTIIIPKDIAIDIQYYINIGK